MIAKRGTGHIMPYGHKIIAGVYEHVSVVEKAMGKPLRRGAIVHHVDENPLNNTPTNLVVCPDRSYHMLLHRRQAAYDACGHYDWLRCRFCGKYDDPVNLHVHRSERGKNYRIYHNVCANADNRARYAKNKLAYTASNDNP